MKIIVRDGMGKCDEVGLRKRKPPGVLFGNFPRSAVRIHIIFLLLHTHEFQDLDR
jgi:hypothetical protein